MDLRLGVVPISQFSKLNKVKSFGNIASLWLALASIGGTNAVATFRRGPACDENKSIFYSPTQGEEGVCFVIC